MFPLREDIIDGHVVWVILCVFKNKNSHRDVKVTYVCITNQAVAKTLFVFVFSIIFIEKVVKQKLGQVFFYKRVLLN